MIFKINYFQALVSNMLIKICHFIKQQLLKMYLSEALVPPIAMELVVWFTTIVQ